MTCSVDTLSDLILIGNDTLSVSTSENNICILYNNIIHEERLFGSLIQLDRNLASEVLTRCSGHPHAGWPEHPVKTLEYYIHVYMHFRIIFNLIFCMILLLATCIYELICFKLYLETDVYIYMQWINSL